MANELYRDFLDKKFDEILDAIRRITPTNRTENNQEDRDNART